MSCIYQNLEKKIFERGIKFNVIANAIHISTKSLKNKRDGESPFTWNEVCTIQRKFFPDVTKEILFTTDKTVS